MSHSKVDRYVLSFTVGGLLEREATILVPLYIEARDWAEVREVAVQKNLLQTRTRGSSVRFVRETVRRLSALTDGEVEALPEISATDRKQLLWVAMCRCYALVGDFAEEVLRGQFLVLAGTLTHDDYDSFYRIKSMWHEELGTVADSTYKKLRQVLFKAMVEAGLLDDEGNILPALITGRIAELLSERASNDLRYFPTRLI